ncbi:MAG: VWA domain-containing protein [Planctomycetota bacterium]|nr:VWA domain-containing protein [Planctomycetota bacterium]
MRPTRVLPALLAVLFAGLPVQADETPAPADVVRQALVRLGDEDAKARADAFQALELVLADNPALGPRCLGRLKAVLRRWGHVDRSRVMTLLGVMAGEEARALWLERLDIEVEPDERVLQAAVDAARYRKGDTTTQRELVRLVRANRMAPTRRALLYETLGHFDGPVVLVTLAQGRTPEEGAEPWVEAAGRALGLGNRRDEASIPPLLTLLEHADKAVVMAAWESLVSRTGQQQHPPEPAPWRAWWKAHQAAKAKPEPAEEGEDGDRYAPPKHVHVPTYYEVPIPRPGSKVVFCIDVSQSMYGHGIQDARRHLSKTLRELPIRHGFDIIAFNHKIQPFARRVVQAHPVMKWRALQWLAQLETTSLTNLYDAVETAFQYMGRGRVPAADPVELDMVFLLSDGAPNRGRYRDEDRVVKHIGRLSKRDVPVHTVAAGERVFDLLKRIAEATGGTFTDAFE